MRYVELAVFDGHRREIYSCLNNMHDISVTLTACSIEDTDHVVKCCNTSDYCNRDIHLSLPSTITSSTISTTTVTPLPTLEDTPDGSTGKALRIHSYCTHLIKTAELCFLIEHLTLFWISHF